MPTFDLGVLGADDPLGTALLELLQERELPVGRLHALSLEESEACASFRGEEWPCEAAAGFDYGRVQALLVASRAAAVSRVVEAARRRNPDLYILTLADVEPAPAVAVTRVLRSIAMLGGPLAADAFVTMPVSYVGRAGVEELAAQTRGLFGMDCPDAEVFPLRIAFNLLPQVAAGGLQDFEAHLRAACSRLCAEASVQFSAVWAPLFFNAAVQLHVRAPVALDARALRAALRRRDDLVLMEADLPAAAPTPATDAQGSEAVFVGRIRDEGERVRFWLVFDPLRLESAAMLAALENWIDKRANSMLT